MDLPSPSAPFVWKHERRRSPRMRVPTVLHVDIRRAGGPLPVHDVNVSGFAVESDALFEPGTLHRCAFMPLHAEPVTLLAQVVRSGLTHGTSRFVTSFRFSMIEPDSSECVKRLIDSVTASLRSGSSEAGPGTGH
jgi:hypothetical protein